MKRIFMLFVLSAVESVIASVLVSPNHKVRADYRLADGFPEVAVSYEGRSLGTVDVGPDYTDRDYGRYVVLTTSVRTVRSSWKPIWGFRSEYPERFTEHRIELALPETDETALTVELRTYDEGLAVRYEMPLETYALDEITRDRIDFHLPEGSVAWPIDRGEGTYPEKPLAVKDLRTDVRWRMSFTLRTPDGVYASILEAQTVKWPRSLLKADGAGGLRSCFAVGTKTGREYVVSPWRVMLMAPSAGGLIERSYLVENLNEPCRVKDAAAWIRPGLTTSDFGRLDNASLLDDARVAKKAGVKYLQIDWGWYGTERPWTDAERQGFRRKRPDLKDDEWMANTYANPYQSAKGYVPYHPFWPTLLYDGRKNVDLDIPALVRDLKAMDMGLCLYLHGLVLEASNMEELFAHYEKWGVSGLKPGFVSWGSQPATDALRQLADCAARHHLWLDIHDAQLPDGFERTWPNVMITEGGGGEEGHHPVHQDCALPFARCLAGPFDYTPRFFDPLRTKGHAAAMLVVYPGPTAVMRWSIKKDKSAGNVYEQAPAVFDFARSLPMNYDEIRVPVAEISRKIVVVRRKGSVWYVGGLCGSSACSVDFALDFLEEATVHEMEIVLDDGGREIKRVLRGERLSISMKAGGGFAAVIKVPCPRAKFCK